MNWILLSNNNIFLYDENESPIGWIHSCYNLYKHESCPRLKDVNIFAIVLFLIDDKLCLQLLHNQNILNFKTIHYYCNKSNVYISLETMLSSVKTCLCATPNMYKMLSADKENIHPGNDVFELLFYQFLKMDVSEISTINMDTQSKLVDITKIILASAKPDEQIVDLNDLQIDQEETWEEEETMEESDVPLSDTIWTNKLNKHWNMLIKERSVKRATVSTNCCRGLQCATLDMCDATVAYECCSEHNPVCINCFIEYLQAYNHAIKECVDEDITYFQQSKKVPPMMCIDTQCQQQLTVEFLYQKFTTLDCDVITDKSLKIVSDIRNHRTLFKQKYSVS